jgi:tetratricopeptide (TPR) repeat protein
MNALATRDNILYNGNIALNKGIVDLKSKYVDNFWEILPVERMQISQEQAQPGQKKNANFDRAETKATMAIQKHSMNIGGSEKNPQMDEAHLLLGKSRYYDQRFIPALEAFNYVLYKYPNSDKIYIVKIWREKTNMRLGSDEMAVTNLRKLLSEIKFKDQVFADANATLAQAFLNLKERDSAVGRLELATKFTKLDEEKSRYRFIMGQIYDDVGKKDSAFAKYQQVIDMHRSAARQYVIQAHARQAQQFDVSKGGDTLAFMKKYKKLLKDRENRPYLDVINHQVALFYDKLKMPDVAKKYYNKSIKKRSDDTYLLASNYRNLADIYFNKAKYVTAGKYFDSTLTNLKSRTREFKLITKKRQNLDDVIKFEGIAQRNDSLLKIAGMSPSARESYYNDYIDKLKKDEKKQQELAEKAAKDGVVVSADSANPFKGKSKDGKEEAKMANSDGAKKDAPTPAITPTPIISSSDQASTFYFYNPSTVAFGKIEFKKKWGDRAHVENWRLFKEDTKEDKTTEEVADGTEKGDKSKKIPEKYTADFYLKQLPTTTKKLDSIGKERNFAYYQLGVIYKEKFKEYKRAADKLEKLLDNKPEERLVLPAMYNLYKIYEIIDPSKATAMKSKIIAQYPDSRYAQIISNPSGVQMSSTPEVTYNTLYQEYLNGQYREVLPKTEAAIDEFTGEEMLPKFELLKANLIGKLKGLEEFKKALNYVALTYPNSSEGKSTEKFIATKIPYLESLTFNSEFPLSWKILYRADNLEDKKTKDLLAKLTKFAKERTIEKLNVSTDIYTIDKNFIVIHGIKAVENAKGIAQVLKEFKDYKIEEPAIVISSENYKVVQVKKNVDEYVSGGWLTKPIVPIQRNIIISQDEIEKVVKEEPKKPTEQGKEAQDSPNAATGKVGDMQKQPNNTPKDNLNTNGIPSGMMMPPTPDMPKK